MKHLISLLLCAFVTALATSQTFPATNSLPIDLDNGTSYSGCGTPGTKAFNFSVTGVGVLNTSDLQLAEIRLRLSATCGGNLSAVSCYIKSPSGTCVQIAPQMGTTSNYTVAPTNRIDYQFRNQSSCLNKAPDYSSFPSSTATASNGSGRFGVFSTSGDIETAFAGQNADGIWTIYFAESTTSAPCVTLAELVFGDPSYEEASGLGNQCVNAINWTGGPFCSTSSGMSGSSNIPGMNSSGSFSSSFGCSWNNSNDNTVWVAFQPTETEVCVNLSGLTDNQQSIVVQDPNTDGDGNACTGANGGMYWNVVSCPRDNIYSAVTGTNRNQTHCFTATPGQTYYLVIDGNGGATSPFYVTGLAGLPDILPVALHAFSGECVGEGVLLSWSALTELNNDYYSIEYSEDGLSWETKVTIKGAGTTNHTQEYSWLDRKTSDFGYYRLSQTDYDGTHVVLKTIIVTCNNSDGIEIVPNPNNGTFRVVGLTEGDQVEIIDPVGRVLERKSATTNFSQHEIQKQSVGVYVARITTGKLTLTKKFVIR